MSHPYEHFVHRVQKPARYVGGELHQVVKDPEEVAVSICLTFPDIYDIGMSHLGTKILYKTLNEHADIACERAFCPWIDMEAELRQRKLPLISLESARPLSQFDVLGFSLQYEMTYTNVLTILSLAGIPLRAADRGEDEPLILGGGPCATHPEAVAPFFDAFLIGDAEERLPELLRKWKADRQSGCSRREALIRMAAGGAVYCPELYTRDVDPRSGLLVVTGTIDPRVPEVVERALVEDLNDHPFPADSPVAAAEAIFDRMSIEIARGCTEGCRFCQAGMIYRPVRERDPNAIVDTVLEALDRGGYDEASLTSLSTADYSCISPLIKKIMARLRERQVSLGVSSLRAYGLGEPILDEIRSVRATGLTFAPEAGTQRMRDIVNKNVSEEDIITSAHRVFSRGWKRMKLYFMIGLPLEQPEDVLGIVETAGRVRKIGRGYLGRRAEVTASVSSHVPKPHTPFQWAAMDSIEEIRKKQLALREASKRHHVQIKHHNVKISYLEGIVSRGDRRVAPIIEAAWRAGCRFDGWDDQLNYDAWIAAMRDAEDFEPMRYLGTLPVDGRLPWDHIDVGLADGFLAQEWKRTCKGKLSPPCGKPKGDIIHHTNLREAEADARKLVCYHCGVACDLTKMRAERIDFLTDLGALEAPVASEDAAPPVEVRDSRGKPKPPKRKDAVAYEDMVKYRLRYAKAGLVRLQGHRDLLRILPRVFRRAGLPVAYSHGFHPKPVMTFSPALPLGYYSASEYVDVALREAVPTDQVLARANAAADPGLVFIECRCLEASEPHCAAKLDSTDWLVVLPDLDQDAIMTAARRLMAAADWPVDITRKKGTYEIDARPALLIARAVQGHLWPDVLGERPEGGMLHLRLRLNIPAPRPRELASSLFGEVPAEAAKVARIGLWRPSKTGVLATPMTAPVEPTPPATNDVAAAEV